MTWNVCFAGPQPLEEDKSKLIKHLTRGRCSRNRIISNTESSSTKRHSRKQGAQKGSTVTHRKVPYLLDSFSRHRMLVRIPGFCNKLFHLSQIADTQCHIAETKFLGIIQGWPTAHQDHAMKNHHWAIASRFRHLRCTSNDWMLQWQDVIALLIVAYQAYQVLPSPQAQKVSIFFEMHVLVCCEDYAICQ